MLQFEKLKAWQQEVRGMPPPGCILQRCFNPGNGDDEVVCTVLEKMACIGIRFTSAKS